MELIGQFLQSILDMGPTVVLPIIIIILGMGFRIPFGKTFKAAITIGIGFIGINLIIGLLTSSIGSAAQTMTERWGLNLTILDVGWPVAAAISFGTPFVFPVILLVIVINLIMLALNWTKILYIDVWNYWHMIFAAAIIYFATDNLILAYTSAALTTVLCLKFSDIYAKKVTDFIGIEGVAMPTAICILWAPIAIGMNKLIDMIPGVRDIEWTDDVLRSKLKLFGEPMIMGLILGAIIGILAGYNYQKVLTLAMQTSAVLLLLPRMVRLLMEGLTVIADGVRDFMMKYMPGREVLLGLDAAIAVGDPALLTCALLMLPITLILAAVLPGNQVLPFGDLGTLPFFCLWPMIAARKNLFRGVLISSIVITCMLYLTTWMAPHTTAMAQAVNFDIPEGSTEISALIVGGELVPVALYAIADFFGL